MLSVLSQDEVNKATGIMPGISIHTGNPICVLNSLNILKLRDEMTALSQFYSIENDSIEIDPIAITPQASQAFDVRNLRMYVTPQASQSFDARNLRMYATPQASPSMRW